MTRRCVCPGSYDPVTNGHLDVIRRARGLFDEVVVAIMINPNKQGLFTPDERAALVKASMPGASGIRVDLVTEGLLVDYCTSIDAPAVVKGLRGGTDFAYELPMALMNKHLTGLETLFMPGDPQLEHVSSSLVKEVASHGGNIGELVPGPVLNALNLKYGEV